MNGGSKRTMCQVVWSDATNVAALSQVQSGWLDMGKRAPAMDFLRSSTNGTYVLEVDWSKDAGSTTLTTDTITTTAGAYAEIPNGKARWCRIRVKNTHATNAFTAHSTSAAKDAATGR